MKTLKTVTILFSLFILVSLIFMSCYSVRIKVANGVGGEPDDTEREDDLSGLLVRELDTIVTVKLTTNENPINIRDCKSGSLHSVEYKSTFGGVLLYVVTFGRKRTVKVKYVCTKKQIIGDSL